MYSSSHETPPHLQLPVSWVEMGGREREREGKASRESHIEMCIIFGHKNLVRECTVGTYTHTYMHTHITLHTHVLYVHIHAHTYRRKGEMDEEERRDG